MNFWNATPRDARLAWAAGLSLLSALLALYAAGFLAFRLERQVAAWQALVLPLTAAGLLWTLLRGEEKSKRLTVGLFGILMTAVAVSVAVSVPFHDFSWDGMTSRALLVRWMSQGFPAQEVPTLNFGHLLSAYAMELTGNWNAGKAVNLLLMAACFCLVAASLKDAGFRFARSLALLITLNPVAIYQISSFQVDGHVACLLSILIVCLAGIIHGGAISPPAATAALLATVGLTLAKNSGIFYAGLVLGIFAVTLAIRSRSWKPLGLVAGLLVLVTLVFGFALRESMNYGALRPDYIRRAMSSQGYGYGYTPGGGASQIEEFSRSSKLRQFLASNFSYTEIAPTEINWKPPFWLIRREIRVFEELTPDPRAGGFGPLYGTALLLGWAAFFAALLGRTAGLGWHGWFLLAAILATSFPTQVWWARWVPQLWLLALIPLLMIAGSKQPNGKPVRVLGGLTVAALVVNLGLIILYYGLGMARAQRVLDNQLELLQKLPQPVSLFVPRFAANQSWLEDAGVEVELSGEKPAVPRMKIVKTTSWVGLPPGWVDQITRPQFLAELRKRDLLEE